MIQFSKPRRALVESIDQYRRHDSSAREYLGNTPTNSGTPSCFDASFYRTHDPLNYIPSGVQSLRLQATYSSSLPSFNSNGPFNAGGVSKRSGYGPYAPSIMSQGGAGDRGSVIGDPSERVGYSHKWQKGVSGGTYDIATNTLPDSKSLQGKLHSVETG
jgi:regulator of nonsense transcripts 1